MKIRDVFRSGIMVLFLGLTLVPCFSSQGATVKPATVPDTKPSAAATANTRLSIAPPFPFSVGESLTYEFKISRFPIFGMLGQIEMKVVTPDPLPGTAVAPADSKEAEPATGSHPLIAFRAEAETRGLIPGIFGLKVKDVLYSAVDGQDLGSLYTQKEINEGTRQRKQVGIFNREKATLELSDTDLTAAHPTPATRTLENRPWTASLLSFWYVLRTQPLEKGRVIPVVLTDEGKVYNIDVVVGEAEKIEVGVGKFSARRLEIKANEAQFVRRQGEFLLWISDDAARLPLRVRFRTSNGTVTGDLVKMRRPVKSATPPGKEY